jgi:hypothetical protein
MKKDKPHITEQSAMKEQLKSVNDLFADIIEVANKRGGFEINTQDFLYYRIGEEKDKISALIRDEQKMPFN